MKKAEKMIVKRQAIFGQMNNYTLDQLATIITETNQQLNYNVKGSSISSV
jgi:Holliday junction resolvasome RuvABC ATP-dependent DNA helicase subunit